MATLEAFESNLKEAVRGKRLSASKMTKTTEIAVQLMENDTKLVAILYRTHKALPPTCKISGLYAFDALARAAKSYATKHKQSVTNTSADKGNCATFLQKLEGVLDGLVRDMLKSGNDEAKDKTKKVLDIWSKAGTFPPAVLTRLSNKLEGTEQEPATPSEHAPQPSSVPTPPLGTPPAQATAAVPATDPQATLIALLSQAASAAAGNNGQTLSNTAAPHLDALQSALLKQLAQTTQVAASGGILSPTGLPPHPPALPAVPPSYGAPAFPLQSVGQPVPGASPPHAQPPYPSFTSGGHTSGPSNGQQNGTHFPVPAAGGNPRFAGPHQDSRDPRFSGPDRHFDSRGPRDGGRGSWSSDRDPRRDDRQRFEGRDPRFAGRNQDHGRDDNRGDPRRRDDRDNRPRFEAGDRRPADFARPRTRSRSPAGARYPPSYAPREQIVTAHALQGKDEFGRDIRAGSAEPEASPVLSRPAHAPEPAGSGIPERIVAPPFVEPVVLAPVPPADVASASGPGVTAAAPVVTGGLDTLDLSTMDFAQPAAWETIGQAWNNTHGTLPTQEQLMQFIMTGQSFGTSDAASAGAYGNTGQQEVYGQQEGAYAEGYQGRGMGRGRGRGGGGRGGRGRGGHYTGAEDAQYVIPVYEGSGRDR